MHDDGSFHTECPLCVETALVSYLDECCTILRHMYRDQLQESFRVYIRSFDVETQACVLHDEPVYTIAMFFGIDKLGDELEADSLFRVIESSAAPLRQRRLGGAKS